jgi:hypothetical protein
MSSQFVVTFLKKLAHGAVRRQGTARLSGYFPQSRDLAN